MFYLRSFNRFTLISLALLGFSVSSVSALTIDFEEIDNTFDFSQDSVNSQGFNFENNCFNPTGGCILHWGESSPFNADSGGVTYSHNTQGSMDTLTQIGGGAFDLLSIDFTGVFNREAGVGNPDSFRVTGNYLDGSSVFTDIHLADITGLQTFVFGWTSLSSATIGGPWVGPEWLGIQMDNLVVNDASTPSVVPVPAAIWLFGSALIGLVRFGKRRKAA